MDWLAHYGIKGQKWGVRRYQNPDGSLTALGKVRYRMAVSAMARRAGYSGKKSGPYGSDPDEGNNIAIKADRTGKIPKGSKLYRVSLNPDETIDSNRKYASLSRNAGYAYTDLAIEGSLNNDGKWVGPENLTKIRYAAIKDLKVATTKQVEDYIASINPQSTKVKTIQRDVRWLTNGYNWDSPKNDIEKMARKYVIDGNVYLNNIYRKELFGTKYDKTNKVFKHFMQKGYDAVSDIEDGGLSSSFAPVVILNPKESLSEESRSYHDRSKGKWLYEDPDYYEYDPDLRYDH